MKRIYIYQYSEYFKVTSESFIQFMLNGLSDNGYDLNDYNVKVLKSRPKDVCQYEGDRKPWSSSSDVKVVCPLDWTRQDFIEEIISGILD